MSSWQLLSPADLLAGSPRRDEEEGSSAEPSPVHVPRSMPASLLHGGPLFSLPERPLSLPRPQPRRQEGQQEQPQQPQREARARRGKRGTGGSAGDIRARYLKTLKVLSASNGGEAAAALARDENNARDDSPPKPFVPAEFRRRASAGDARRRVQPAEEVGEGLFHIDL